MDKRELLRKLKGVLKTDEMSVTELSVKLGYRSPSAVYGWFTDERIPATAVEKVTAFLKERGVSVSHAKKQSK